MPTTVTKIGAAAHNGGGTAIPITTSGTATAGGLVVILTWVNSSSGPAPTAIVDSAGNSATNAFDVQIGYSGSSAYLAISSYYVTATLASGGVITVTLASFGSYSVVYYISSGASTNWVDQTASNSNTVFQAAQTTGTTSNTTNASDVAIAGFVGTVSSTATWGSYTELDSLNQNSRQLQSGYLLASTGTQAAPITLSASDTTGAAIAVYKQGGGVAAVTGEWSFFGVGTT